MNCFDWHNYSSDYLDGELQEPLRTNAEMHLNTCPDCLQHYKHYGLILSALADQPRSQIPAHIRNAPLAPVITRLETARISLSRWERIPWYLRVSLEATGIVALVLLCISSSPKIRSIYEKNIERNMNEFKESLNVNDGLASTLNEGLDPSLIATAGKPPATALNEANGATQENPGNITGNAAEELNGEDDSVHNSGHAGQSQLWRFTLKTVSPDEMRPQVIKALQELKIPANTRGLGGTQVPGGIEFDLILPQSMVPNIKAALEKIIPEAVRNKEYPVGSEIFTWYKVKSRKALPEGTSKVVIWLSQPN